MRLEALIVRLVLALVAQAAAAVVVLAVLITGVVRAVLAVDQGELAV